MSKEYVWIFNGAGSRFPSGVFEKRERAEKWIKQNHLTGILTKYPIGVGVFDWAIENGFFKPEKESHNLPDFVGKFSSAAQEHYHFEAGNSEH